MAWQILPEGTLGRLTDGTVAATLGDPLPRFFMTGDGHRHPPFQWTQACSALKIHFMTLMAEDKLCVHVEQQPEEVSGKSLPPFLNPLVHMKKVFGWELAIYRDLQPIMESCMDLATGSLNPMQVTDDVVLFDKRMVRVDSLLWQVGNPMALKKKAESWKFREYYEGVRRKGQPRQQAKEDEFRQFLLAYSNSAMRLRTDANRYIATNIQRVISQYPDHTHVITCGDAHIKANPLQNYILLGGAAVGIVDPGNM